MSSSNCNTVNLRSQLLHRLVCSLGRISALRSILRATEAELLQANWSTSFWGRCQIIPAHMSIKQELRFPKAANQSSCPLLTFYSLLCCAGAQGLQPHARAHSVRHCTNTEESLYPEEFTVWSLVSKITPPKAPLYNPPWPKSHLSSHSNSATFAATLIMVFWIIWKKIHKSRENESLAMSPVNINEYL